MRRKMVKASVVTILAVLSLSCGGGPQAPQQEKLADEAIKGVPFTEITLNDIFWTPKIEVNRTVSIPSALHQCDINGRFDNFAVAAGLLKKEHQGDFSFDDTDPYKVIEGASYSLAVHYDAALDHRLDSLISLIAAAQQDDGYLTTCVINKCDRLRGWWGTHRWEKVNSHELYNSGHMIESAIAHYMATGKRTFLDVAIKNADHICKFIGPEEGQIHLPSGHPIIEMAMVKLYDVTGDTKYLDQAWYFVKEAGRGTDGHRLSEYSQDHKPVLEQDEIVGHAVRAGYFYSGVADVVRASRDTAYFRALCRIWNNMVSQKLYITGGIGSRAQGEGFGPGYELHNQQCYCETCASISNVYWNYRMFLATGDAKYIDVLERALYNGVISGVSLSGDKFFYDNPLESSGQHERQEWFGCACCPGNVTRFMASVPTYMYAVQGDAVYVNLYIRSEGNITLPEGNIKLTQTTDYPWDGAVSLAVNLQKEQEFTLKLRIPSWVNGKPVPSDLYHFTDEGAPYVIKVNGKKVRAAGSMGYVSISRSWKSGDVVSVEFPMNIRLVAADEKVEDDRGKVAIQRGPIVYCLEGRDQSDGEVFNKYISADTRMTAAYDNGFLNGIMVINGGNFTAIPYYSWNNRGTDEMAVWVPLSEEGIRTKPEPTIASKARSYQEIPGGREDWADGVNDQWEPSRSSDISKPYLYWWLRSGVPVNVAYEFEKAETVSETSVYWLEFDHYDGDYRVPVSWKLLYKNGAASRWKEVTLEEGESYGCAADCYNTVRFSPVTATHLKIEAMLQEGESGGIIEWKVR